MLENEYKKKNKWNTGNVRKSEDNTEKDKQNQTCSQS